MEFDRYSILLLVTPDAPAQLDEAARARIQDEHLSHLADLHEAGSLLAVGPLSDPEGKLRGLSVLAVDVDEARRLAAADPAVRAGVFEAVAIPWAVPAGGMHFTPTRLPRSMADAQGD